jgi:hypothetical protein
MMAYRGDPDDLLVVVFKLVAEENIEKSRIEGRPIFEEKEHCVITSGGCKDIKVFPATEFSRWVDDPVTGRQVKQSYAERFRHQYQQFKRQDIQTKSGTPLDHTSFLSEGRRAELKAQNIYTVEMLAAVEGNELKNLGPGGREMKNKAVEYIEESRSSAPNKQLVAELEALRARNEVLEGDVHMLKSKKTGDGDFDDMTDKHLRDFITTHTGQVPVGNLPRKTLVRMAMDARPDKVA